jgi:hypothetical protein
MSKVSKSLGSACCIALSNDKPDNLVPFQNSSSRKLLGQRILIESCLEEEAPCLEGEKLLAKQ